MSQSSFKKILSPSEVGGKKMNDKYLTFKSKVDYLNFYGQTSPRWFNHIDKASKEEYTFRYDNEVSNGEVKLCEMGLFYSGRGAVSGDEVHEDAAEYYPEGSRQSILVNKYERNTKAREKCIEHHGVICKACDFNFEGNYGEVGEGFIHVHHIKPVSEIGETYEVDLMNHLIPVCPNCHAMIHKRKPPYSIKEIKEMM